MNEMISSIKTMAKDVRPIARPSEPARRGEVLGLTETEYHQIAYVEWGPLTDPRPIICVHGLTRQCRDFDYLAADLAARGRRVVCVDLPGRGRSEWLSEPAEYALPEYCAAMNAVMARLGADEFDWVGTSLGGLIGIVLAGMPGSRIGRLVVNDIGPYVSSVGLMRIGQYLREMPESFPSIAVAQAYFQEILAPYGELEDKYWKHITDHSVEWDESRGEFINLCDKNVGYAFRFSWFSSVNLWKYWEEIRSPVLVLHGEQSDLLTDDLIHDMASRNPNAAVRHFPDCGHVPPLFEPHQTNVVLDFLSADETPPDQGRRRSARTARGRT